MLQSCRSAKHPLGTSRLPHGPTALLRRGHGGVAVTFGFGIDGVGVDWILSKFPFLPTHGTGVFTGGLLEPGSETL